MGKNIKYITFILLFILIFLPIIHLFSSIFLSKVVFYEFIEFTSFLKRRVGRIFLRSIIIGVTTSLLSTAIGFSFALLFECTNLSKKRFLYFILFLPFLIPAFLIAFSWIILSEGRASLIIPFNFYNEIGVVLFLTLSFFPIGMIISSLGLRNIDASYIEAGILFNKRKIISRIVLPLVKQHLIISCFFIFFLALSEYTVPAFLMVNTYQNEIFNQFAAFYNLTQAVILSFPLLLLDIILVLIMFLYLKNKSFLTVTSFKKTWKPFIKLSKSWERISYLYFFLILLFSFFIPVSSLLYESKLEFFNAIVLSKNSILNSIWITSLSSALLTFLSFFVSYSFKDSKFIILVISLPLALSSPIIGISLINLFSNLPLPIYGSYAILIIGYLVKFLPFGVFIFSSFISQISNSLKEVGEMFTSNEFKILFKIFLPLLKPAFFSTFIISFIFIFGEIGITQLLSPPGFQTLTQRIEVIMHYGDYKTVSSLSLIVFLLIFLFIPLYWWLKK